MKAIILVAGYATRLYPLTLNTPKALLKVGDTTLLDFLIEKLEKVESVDEVYLVSNHKFAKNFEEWAKDKNKQSRLNFVVFDDGTQTNETRLGAIGDIQFVLEHKKIDDDVMVLVSDNYFSFELTNFYDYYKKKQSDVCLGTVFDDLEYLSKNFGVAVLDQDDRVLEMFEKPGKIISDTGVYASYIYKKETLPLFETYLEEGNSKDAPGNFVSWLHKRKPVYCYRFDGECYDVGTIDMYNKINEREKNKKNFTTTEKVREL